MIAILRVAHALDETLKAKLGRPYNFVLGAGLVLEIVGRVRELHDLPETSTNVVRLCLSVVFFLLLLLHQVGELADYRTHARQRRFRDRGRDEAA